MKRIYFICTAVLVLTGMADQVSARKKNEAAAKASDKTTQVEKKTGVNKAKKVEKKEKTVKNQAAIDKVGNKQKQNPKNQVKAAKIPKSGKLKKINKKINKLGQYQQKGKIIRLNLKKALKLAREKNVDLRIKALEIAEARIKKNISKRKLYPVIKVEANALFWNDDLAINFALPENLPISIDMDPIMVREQFTMQTTVTVAQPITPWFSLKALYDLDEVEVAAKHQEFEMARDKIEAKVKEAFFNAYKARSYLEIIEDAEKMLLTQKKRVADLIKYEYATSADLAKVEAALAEVKAQKIKVTASIQLAKQFLAYILGIEINSPLQLIAKPPHGAQVFLPGRCIKMAMQSNPVFKMLKKREEQVELAKKALQWDKYPRVMAVAQYKNSLGFGDFEPMNQGFVGLMVSWKFKWFNRWREEDKINLKNQRIQLNLEKAQRGLSLEIYNNYTKVQNSSALVVSRKAALKAAKTAYTKVENLKKHQYSTVSDLLEARTQLTKARVKLTNAKYDLGLQFSQYQALCK